MEMIGLKETGLNMLIHKGDLELDTYFTSGPEETRAWTIENCTAPKAAGEIHTDFEFYKSRDCILKILLKMKDGLILRIMVK